MIDIIARSEDNPQGQLTTIRIPADVILWPISSEMIFRRVDINNVVIVCNQLDNVRSVIELASVNLVFSCDTITSLLCKRLYSSCDLDSKERVSTDFLLNAILYFNASFDYIRVLMKYVYSSHLELTNEHPRKSVETATRKLSLRRDWELALAKCISAIRHGPYAKWLASNSRISDDVRCAFEKLSGVNGDLRVKYQANQLKHGAFPHFKRSNPANLIDTRILQTMDQFYNKDRSCYKIGFHENQLDIESTQKFLIEYHNCTANIINEIMNDIIQTVPHSSENIA